jgi:hypothetical protein
LPSHWREKYPIGSRTPGRAVDCKNRRVDFYGTQPCKTIPLKKSPSKGMVFFSRAGADHASDRLRDEMEAIGFSSPEPGSLDGQGRSIREAADVAEERASEEEMSIDSRIELHGESGEQKRLPRLISELIDQNSATTLRDAKHDLLLGSARAAKEWEKCRGHSKHGTWATPHPSSSSKNTRER